MQDTLKLIGTRSLKLCVIVLAVLIGFGLAACGNGTTDQNTGADDEPLVYKAVVNGKTVEITVSRTDPSRAVLTPRAGDFYVIKLNGVVISKGTVTKVESGGRTTFTPAADSPGPKTEFVGTFATGSLSLPTIPMEDGDLTGVNATPGGGTTTGGGGGGGGGGSRGGGGGSTTNPSQEDPVEPPPAPPAPTKVGTITITDIPAAYNGKYAAFYAGQIGANDNELYGCENVTGTKWTLSTITDRSAVIPIWALGTWFTGNEKLGTGKVYLTNESSYDSSTQDEPPIIDGASFSGVAFSSGDAEISWNNRNVYTDGGLTLDYIDKAETTHSHGTATYTTSHYLLVPGNFDEVKAALIREYGTLGNQTEENDLFIGTSLSNTSNFLIFEVNDFSAGNWGIEYRLVEQVDGIVNQGVIWRSDEMEADSNNTSFVELENGQAQLKPSDVLLYYLTSLEVTHPTSGRVHRQLTLADFAAAKTVLESAFGTPTREQEYSGTPPASSKVMLFITDYTDGDPTYPNNGGVNGYTLQETGADDNGEQFLMNSMDWYPPLD